MTFARVAAGPRPRASEQLCPLNPPRSPSGRRLARHPSSNDDGAATTRRSASEQPCLPRRPACLLVLHCSRPSRPLKPPNCLGRWRPGSTPKMPHSLSAHEAKGPFRIERGTQAFGLRILREQNRTGCPSRVVQGMRHGTAPPDTCFSCGACPTGGITACMSHGHMMTMPLSPLACRCLFD